MTLYSLGLSQLQEDHAKNNFPSCTLGRVVSEHKERYIVLTETGTFSAEITGALRYSAENRADFPAVGDFVALMPFDGSAIIMGVLPRKTTLARQAVGGTRDEQLIATNIDSAFLVQAADRDFSPNRLERYMALCNAAKITPIILLSKIDTQEKTVVADMLTQLRTRFSGTVVLGIHAQNPQGFAAVLEHVESGKTICVLGSSGVGKSTLINNLRGEEILETSEINEQIGRGRHTTTHRELAILPSGAILVDTPGMREVGLTDVGDALDDMYEDIAELIEQCAFANCAHNRDRGCAVHAAIDAGELSAERWKNYGKLKRESERFSQSVAEKRKKDKELGKMYKEHIFGKKKNRR